MLVNGVHLLPDLSGALLWPKERLLAVADARLESRPVVERLTRLLRQVQPKSVVCLGARLGRPAEADLRALRRAVASCHWLWLSETPDASPAAELGGEAVAELTRGDLTFRHKPRPDAPPGEVAGAMLPRAAVVTGDGRLVRPCFVMDGRRLVMPGFAADAGGGLDVLDAAWRPLFRRAFTVILLGRERLHTYPRGRLDGAPGGAAGGGVQELAVRPRAAAPSGRRFQLFPGD